MVSTVSVNDALAMTAYYSRNYSVWKDRHEKSELASPAKMQQCLKTAVSNMNTVCF